MNRLKSLTVFSALFLFAVSIATAQANAPTKEEMARLLKDLTKATKEVTTYRDQFLSSPQIVALKKETADFEKALRTKAHEVEALLNALYNKNPEFANLAAKIKESYAVNSELNKIHSGIESSPEVANLKKEAAGLRAKAFTLDQKARKLAESKFSSDETVKKLQDKRAHLGDPTAKLFVLKKEVLNSPDIKALQAEIAKLKANLITKATELRQASNDALKMLNGDEKFKALEQRAGDLNQKVRDSRKAPPAVSTHPKAK